MPTTPREYLSELAPGTGQSRRTSSKVSRSTTGRYAASPAFQTRGVLGFGRAGPRNSRTTSAVRKRGSGRGGPVEADVDHGQPSHGRLRRGQEVDRFGDAEGDRLVGEHGVAQDDLARGVGPTRQVHGDDPGVLGDLVDPCGRLSGQPGAAADPEKPVDHDVGLGEQRAALGTVRLRVGREHRHAGLQRRREPTRVGRRRVHRRGREAALGEVGQRHTGRRRRCCRTRPARRPAHPAVPRGGRPPRPPAPARRAPSARPRAGRPWRPPRQRGRRRRRSASITSLAFRHDDRRRDAGVVRDRQVERSSTPRSSAARRDRADDLDRGRPAGVPAHRGVVPAQPPGRAERLGDGLLGGEPGGQRGRERAPRSVGGEQPLAQARRPRAASPRTARRRRRRCRRR